MKLFNKKKNTTEDNELEIIIDNCLDCKCNKCKRMKFGVCEYEYNKCLASDKEKCRLLECTAKR